jgi:hypothetical protein
MHFKLRMTPDYAVNPFDTQLGCRYPLPEERSYLTELLTLLCTSPGQKTPYDGMTPLVGCALMKCIVGAMTAEPIQNRDLIFRTSNGC